MLIEATKEKKYIFPTPKYREKIKKNSGMYYKMNELKLKATSKGLLEIQENKEVYQKYSDNIECVYDIKLITRKQKTLAKYWLLMQALEFHFGVSQIDGKEYKMTDKLYDLYFKRKYLAMDRIYNPITKNFEYFDKHINFGDMPEESSFLDYFFKVTREVNEMGYDVDELIESMGVE